MVNFCVMDLNTETMANVQDIKIAVQKFKLKNNLRIDLSIVFLA